MELFDPALDTVITTDASAIGLGAVLQQWDGHDLVFVAFTFQSLTDQQRKYSIGKLEVSAFTWACGRWRRAIKGTPIYISYRSSGYIDFFEG